MRERIEGKKKEKREKKRRKKNVHHHIRVEIGRRDMGTLKKSWNSFELETRFTKNSYHGSTREFFSRYDSRSASGYRYEGRKKKKEKNGEEILFVKTICKYTVQTNIEFLFILMEVFIYIYIFFYLATSLKFIYLFFLSVSLKYILNGRIPLRVLFIMFAIDSTGLGILFHENRIGESYKKSSVSIFFSFFLPLFF